PARAPPPRRRGGPRRGTATSPSRGRRPARRPGAGPAGETGYLPVPGMSLPEDLTHPAAGGFRSLADGREGRVLADRYGSTAPGNGEVPGAFRHEWVTFIHSSLRSVPVRRQVYRQGAEHPLAYLGGPRDKPGAGRPRPPRGQARVAARL